MRRLLAKRSNKGFLCGSLAILAQAERLKRKRCLIFWVWNPGPSAQKAGDRRRGRRSTLSFTPGGREQQFAHSSCMQARKRPAFYGKMSPQQAICR